MASKEQFDQQMKLWERINGDVSRMSVAPTKSAGPDGFPSRRFVKGLLWFVAVLFVLNGLLAVANLAIMAVLWLRG